MDKKFLLDTSAIFAFTKAESGCDAVEDILVRGQKGKQNIYLSFISFAELYYITWKEKGEHAAKELMVLIKSLPLQIVESNERLTLLAGRLKAKHPLSLADAFIAATAIDKNAVLIHKDPELQIISQYTETLELPFKKNKI